MIKSKREIVCSCIRNHTRATSAQLLSISVATLAVFFVCILGPAAHAVDPIAKPAASEAAPAVKQKTKKAAQPTDQDQPINIASDQLTVRQNENLAIFVGNVDAVQGTMRLRSDKLKVYYEQAQSDGGTSSGTQSITHMQALGHVVFISGGETARGDRGVYNVRKGTVTLFDNVIVSQGGNVLRGSRLDMDLNTGRSTLKSDSSSRVVGRFVPNSDKSESQTADINESVGN